MNADRPTTSLPPESVLLLGARALYEQMDRFDASGAAPCADVSEGDKQFYLACVEAILLAVSGHAGIGGGNLLSNPPTTRQ